MLRYCSEDAGWEKQKDGSLEARVEWIRGDKGEESDEGVDVQSRTLLELHLPSPSASFDVSNKNSISSTVIRLFGEIITEKITLKMIFWQVHLRLVS